MGRRRTEPDTREVLFLRLDEETKAKIVQVAADVGLTTTAALAVLLAHTPERRLRDLVQRAKMRAG